MFNQLKYLFFYNCNKVLTKNTLEYLKEFIVNVDSICHLKMYTA